MKIKQLKEISILANRFDIVWDKNHSGGSFDFANCKIVIGIKYLQKDPIYVVSIISHEVMEAILVMMGGRIEGARLENNYIFHFDHQTFENAIQLHTELMLKFTQQ
jgi:hypothetical protein